MMKPRVYIETTIFSYLAAWRSPLLVMAANQEVTRQWWSERRNHFDLFVSEAVVQEASAGDPEAAKRRLALIEEIPELDISDAARDLSKALLESGDLPQRAALDALHIAVATVHGMDYLLTWNCRHIANAAIQNSLRRVCEDQGFLLPIICTPLELMEAPRDE